MTKDEALQMCLEYIETDAHERKYVRHAIKEALAQTDNVAQAYLKGFDEASTPSFKAKERLIRVMGTFDLATGHADTWDELLESLESELRDVLGHYREALAQPEQEPVAWLVTYGGLTHIAYTQPNMVVDTHYQPLYTTPPQRTWVGLTDEEIDALHTSIKVRLMGTFDTKDIYRAVEQALKEKNI